MRAALCALLLTGCVAPPRDRLAPDYAARSRAASEMHRAPPDPVREAERVEEKRRDREARLYQRACQLRINIRAAEHEIAHEQEIGEVSGAIRPAVLAEAGRRLVDARAELRSVLIEVGEVAPGRCVVDYPDLSPDY